MTDDPFKNDMKETRHYTSEHYSPIITEIHRILGSTEWHLKIAQCRYREWQRDNQQEGR